jgi:hypothetical protein
MLVTGENYPARTSRRLLHMHITRTQHNQNGTHNTQLQLIIFTTEKGYVYTQLTTRVEVNSDRENISL